MSTSTEIRAKAAPSAHPSDYRHDIDGLRAVAILLVVIYHVWIGRVSGGVDAFLMISAFFLTGSFLRRLENRKPLAIGAQWVRTFKRLLPPAATVLALTLIAGVLLLPDNRLVDLFRQTWASLFYVENWRLAIDATDYYANKSSASPVQHFWSLSVQGQVFLLWPLLFLVVRNLVKRSSLGVRPAAAIVLSVAFIVSFVYSVVTTGTRQEFAYFDTGARVWEFAAGGLLAVVLPWIKLPHYIRTVLGWAGILALLACGMVIDVQGGFPGYLALWPVLSVAAIILAGTGESNSTSVTRALAWKPLVTLGHDAYALYLVHWPILIFFIQIKRGDPLTFLDGLLIIAGSLIAARLLTWLVDDRIRYAKWANSSRIRGWLVILLSITLVTGPTLLVQWQNHLHTEAERLAVEAADPGLVYPGAKALQKSWDREVPSGVLPIPLAGDLGSEWGSLPSDCGNRFAIPFEEYGAGCTAKDTEDSRLTVVVIGDSHTEQWLAPFEVIAEAEEWQVYSFLKGGCALSLTDVDAFEDPPFDASCTLWMQAIISEMESLQPDVIITVGSRATASDESLSADSGEAEHSTIGQDEAIEALRSFGIPVVLLRDNPRFTFNAYECADIALIEQVAKPNQFGANADCGVSRGRALAQMNPADAYIRPGVATVDMTDFICKETSCPAIIGNVFVYLDDNHLTTTYTRTMAPMLKPRLIDAISRARSWEEP